MPSSGSRCHGSCGTLLNTLGEVHRAAGDRTAARQAYREALDEGRVLGEATRFFPSYNLAKYELEEGWVDAAAARLDTLMQWTAHEPWAWLEGTLRLARLTVHMARDDHAAFANDFERGLAQVDRVRGVDETLRALVRAALAEAERRGWELGEQARGGLDL